MCAVEQCSPRPLYPGCPLLKESVLCAGIHKNAFTMFSAHQMGTARMGVSPKKSVVDPEGQCWEVRPRRCALMRPYPSYDS